jgi:hypothetical protein
MEVMSVCQTCRSSKSVKKSLSSFLEVRKVKGVHLSDTQKQLRTKAQGVPLDS